MHILLVVDIQNDFLPGGALAVTQGDAVIPIANQLMRQFDGVVATQDWHPPDHRSFATQHPGRQIGDFIELRGLQQILWPVALRSRQQGGRLCARVRHKPFRQGVPQGYRSHYRQL